MNEAMLFMKPCFKAQFLYFRKNFEYWKVKGRDERRFHSTYYLAVTYQCVRYHHLRPNMRKKGSVKVPKIWGLVEVPRGCLVEIPLRFSYI